MNGDRAAGAVDEHHRVRADRVEPFHGHDAGDAELPSDDRGMAGRPAQRGGQRYDELRIQAGGIGRGEVVGQQNRRDRGQRNAGLGQAAEFGDDPVADVAQVGDSFGHQPAELCEQVDELVDGRHHGANGGGTAVDVLLRGT